MSNLLPGWKLKSYKNNVNQGIYAIDWENEFNALLKAYNVGQQSWFGGHFFPGAVEIGYVTQYILLPPTVVENFEFRLEWIWLSVPNGTITFQLVLNGVPQQVFISEPGFTHIEPITLDPDDEIHFIVVDSTGDPEDVGIQAGGCNDKTNDDVEEEPETDPDITRYYFTTVAGGQFLTTPQSNFMPANGLEDPNNVYGAAQLTLSLTPPGGVDSSVFQTGTTAGTNDMIIGVWGFVLTEPLTFSGHDTLNNKVRINLAGLRNGTMGGGSIWANVFVWNTGSTSVVGYIQDEAEVLSDTIASNGDSWTPTAGSGTGIVGTWTNGANEVDGEINNVLIVQLFMKGKTSQFAGRGITLEGLSDPSDGVVSTNPNCFIEIGQL